MQISNITVEVLFWILGTMSQDSIVQYHMKILLININITKFIEKSSYLTDLLINTQKYSSSATPGLLKKKEKILREKYININK